MFSRIIVRYASKKNFSLPAVNFQYAQGTVDNEERKLPPLYPIEQDKEHFINKGIKNKNRKTTGNENSSNNRNYSKIHSQRSSKELTKSAQYTLQENKHATKFENTHKFDSMYNEKRKSERLKFEGKYRDFNSINKRNAKHEVVGEMIFGIHPILHALQAQRRTFHHLYYKTGLEITNVKISEILELAKRHNLEVCAVEPSQLKRYIGEERVHQGVCCDVSPLCFEEVDAESLFQEWKAMPGIVGNITKIEESEHKRRNEKAYQLWLYMDKIQDPMNFGAILRSAYFMGVDRVLTSKQNSCRLSGVVSKASAGAAELLPVYQVDNLRDLFQKLASDGWNLVCTAAEGTNIAVPLSDYEPNGNMVLAVGNEGLGISPDLQDIFITTLTIQPGRILQPGMDSLNVSVASAVVLHTITSKIHSCRTNKISKS